jgi:hypothetical protein
MSRLCLLPLEEFSVCSLNSGTFSSKVSAFLNEHPKQQVAAFQAPDFLFYIKIGRFAEHGYQWLSSSYLSL